MDTSGARLTFTLVEDRVSVSGEIDASTCESFNDWLDQHGAGGCIIVDMAEVTFIDSSGLRVLITHHQQAVADGRSFELANPSPAVQRLFEITGLTDVLHIRST